MYSAGGRLRLHLRRCSRGGCGGMWWARPPVGAAAARYVGCCACRGGRMDGQPRQGRLGGGRAGRKKRERGGGRLRAAALRCELPCSYRGAGGTSTAARTDG